MEHPAKKLTPKVFMGLLPGPWQMATRKDIILKGFRETEIFPLNPSIVLDNQNNFATAAAVRAEPSTVPGSTVLYLHEEVGSSVAFGSGDEGGAQSEDPQSSPTEDAEEGRSEVGLWEDAPADSAEEEWGLQLPREQNGIDENESEAEEEVELAELLVNISRTIEQTDAILEAGPLNTDGGEQAAEQLPAANQVEGGMGPSPQRLTISEQADWDSVQQEVLTLPQRPDQVQRSERTRRRVTRTDLVNASRLLTTPRMIELHERLERQEQEAAEDAATKREEAEWKRKERRKLRKRGSARESRRQRRGRQTGQSRMQKNRGRRRRRSERLRRKRRETQKRRLRKRHSGQKGQRKRHQRRQIREGEPLTENPMELAAQRAGK
jgi:hypothetical protein